MVAVADYHKFLLGRAQWHGDSGFKAKSLPNKLFPFQKHLVEWALAKGRSAIFADCGTGKTVMQLSWGNAVVEKTNKPVLLFTPLAVGSQTLREAEKFGIDAERSRNGKFSGYKRIVVTNYQQLEKFNSNDFAGCICDESSAIKDFKSVTKAAVVEFMRKLKYRLLCTATAAPNDFWELGTSSEALGYLGFRDMITMFFKQETQKDRLGWGRTKYRFRGHAEQQFWSWVCSWAKCIRKPSDIGFDDDGFELPPLTEHEHIVKPSVLRDGMLFCLPVATLEEQREERRNSIAERVAKAAELVHGHKTGPSVVWCVLNAEADAAERAIAGAKQVSGSMSDDEKEEVLDAFAKGQIPSLITKPKIACHGLNWQHCCNVVTMPSPSFEQHYQLVRRCWRYGQPNPVDVHLVVSEGEEGVLKNINRKVRQADVMFDSLKNHMNDPHAIVKVEKFSKQERVPEWLMTR